MHLSTTILLAAVAACAAAPAAALASPGAHCASTHASCSASSDCCAPNLCTPSPWDETRASMCLPPPPTCYATNTRCAGAPGQPYVPYASCCDGQACVESAKGWGRWCVASEATPEVAAFAWPPFAEKGECSAKGYECGHGFSECCSGLACGKSGQFYTCQ